MIEARHIAKQAGDRYILANLSLLAESGTLLSIFGPNGAGKSTLLRILALLMSPSQGEVWIDGKQATGDNAPRLRRQIGLLSHQSFLYEELSAVQNLDFYGRLYSIPDRKRRVEDAIERAGLTLFATDPVRNYSRGMLQRLAIARTLLHEPSILLLDEPYTGLDQSARRLLDQLVSEAKGRGATVLLVSHDASEGLRAADQILVISRGRAAAAGPVSQWSPARISDLVAGLSGPAGGMAS